MAAAKILHAAPQGELGLWGILRETARILQHTAKHFLCLYLALLLGPAVLLAVITPSYKAQLLSIIAHLTSQYNSSRTALPDQVMPPRQNAHIYTKLPASLAVIGMALFHVFVAMPPLMASVCRGYLGKSLSVRGSMRAVGRAAKGMALTLACMYAVMAGVMAGVTVAVAAALLILKALKVEGGEIVVMVLVGVLSVPGTVYLCIEWMLVKPTVILEEAGAWGWSALRRSSFLVRGKRGLAFRQLLFFALFSFVSLFAAPSPGASLSSQMAVGAAGAAVQSLVGLFSLAALVVFYMTCRSFHLEPIETVSVAHPEFGGAHAEEPKYMDLSNSDV